MPTRDPNKLAAKRHRNNQTYYRAHRGSQSQDGDSEEIESPW